MSRRSLVTLAIASVAIFMVTLDNLVVTTALPSIRADLGASIEYARVDGQRLHADVRRPPAHRRRARRPLRPPAHVRHRPRRSSPPRRPRAALAPTTDALDRRPRASRALGAAIVTPLTLTLLRDGRSRPSGAGSRSAIWSGDRAASASRSARSSAARSSRASRGSGSSGSTSRSASSLIPLAAPRPARELRPRRAGSTCPALALAGAGLLGVVFGIVRGNAAGLDERRRSSARSAAGVALLAAFVAWERRAPAPMLPLRFFRSPRASAATNGVVAGDVLRRLRLDLPAARSSSRPCRATRRWRPACARCRGRACR